MPTTAQLLWENREKQKARDSRFELEQEVLYGYITEVNGSIEGSRVGLVWFKSLEDDSPPMEVFNPGIQNVQANMYCEVKREPKPPARWRILRFDTGRYFDDQAVYEALPGLSGVGPHAKDHEYPPGRPGADPITVYPRAIADFAVRPTSPASMKVRIYGGWYPGSTTYEKFSGPVNSKDFTSDVPGTSGDARIVAITIDDTGTIGYTNGSTFTDGLPVPTAAYPSVSTDVMIISAVRLVSGMSSITERNFDVEIRPVMGPGGLAGAKSYWIDKGGGGGIYYTGAPVGIGDWSATAMPPEGAAQFVVIGPDSSIANGPNIQVHTDADDYPLFQGLFTLHDGIALVFDAYNDGSWRSSNSNANYMIYKSTGVIYIDYDTGVSQGNVVSWKDAFHIDALSGNVVINDSGENINFRVESDTKTYALFVQGSNGNVGIGEGFPASALDVAGRIQQDGSSAITGYLHSNATQLASGTNVNPGILFYGPVAGGNGHYYGADIGYNSGTSRYRTRIFTGADIAFGTTASVAMTAQSDFTENVTFRGDNKRVGIVNSAPIDQLHVGIGTASKDAAVSSYNGIVVNQSAAPAHVTVIYDGDPSTQGGIFAHSNGLVYMGSWTNSDLEIRANNTRAIFVESTNQRVGIATAGPGYPLDVAGQAHATSFPTSSDRRLKRSLSPIGDVLPGLDAITPIAFNWNNIHAKEMKRSDRNRREIGLLAQEVKAQFPELVTEWAAGRERYLAVDYGRFTAVLLKAIQELKAEIDLLKGV